MAIFFIWFCVFSWQLHYNEIGGKTKTFGVCFPRELLVSTSGQKRLDDDCAKWKIKENPTIFALFQDLFVGRNKNTNEVIVYFSPVDVCERKRRSALAKLGLDGIRHSF